MLRNFPENFEPFVLWVRKNLLAQNSRQLAPNFPPKFAPQNQKEIYSSEFLQECREISFAHTVDTCVELSVTVACASADAMPEDLGEMDIALLSDMDVSSSAGAGHTSKGFERARETRAEDTRLPLLWCANLWAFFSQKFGRENQIHWCVSTSAPTRWAKKTLKLTLNGHSTDAQRTLNGRSTDAKRR